MTAPVERLLQGLHKVRRTGPATWLACCPAHEDRSPSLSVKEGDDGRVLLHCHGGCTVHEVTGALGMTLADLFPPRPDAPGGGHKPQRRPWNASDLIELAAFEAGVAVVIVSDVLNGRPEPDMDRLLQAAGRLANVREAVHGSR
jgi:hypothetical protein